MRIGIDARLVYYSHAGIGQYILRLVEALARIDITGDQFVLLQSRKDHTRLDLDSKSNRVSLWTPSHHRLEQVSLRFEIGRLHLDLLHSPDFIPPFWRNCRSVITVHDLAFLLYPHFLTSEAARYYGQIDQAVRHTDHIIAVSESTRRDTINLLGVPERKITVIYEGANPIYRPMDKEVARRHVQDTYGLGEPYILFVSTIEPRKNLPGLLQAFRKLRDDYKRPEMLALAGGQGWLSEEVYDTIDRLNLNEHVRLLGRVPSEHLVYLYNAAQALVHPSFYEGFGLPPLEAMHCGTPTIVSNVSALPEVVGDAALLVDPNDIDGLTVAMWRVLTDDQLRASLVEKGLARAQTFSLERAAQQTVEVYHRVAG